MGFVSGTPDCGWNGYFGCLFSMEIVGWISMREPRHYLSYQGIDCWHLWWRSNTAGYDVGAETGWKWCRGIRNYSIRPEWSRQDGLFSRVDLSFECRESTGNHILGYLEVNESISGELVSRIIIQTRHHRGNRCATMFVHIIAVGRWFDEDPEYLEGIKKAQKPPGRG